MTMFDMVTTGQPLAVELIQRTSSAVRVQHILQLSLAPVFLLAGIGAIMNVMVSRLIWIG